MSAANKAEVSAEGVQVMVPLPSEPAEAAKFAADVEAKGITQFLSILPSIRAGLEDNELNGKLGALVTLKAIADHPHTWFEPYGMTFVSALVDAAADKNPAISKAGEEAAFAVISHISYAGVNLILPALLEATERFQWKTKVAAMRLIGALAHSQPVPIGRKLPEIIQKLIAQAHDTKKEVRAATSETFNQVSSTVDNPDITPIIPDLIRAYIEPVTQTQNAVDKLLSTAFIQPVDGPCLGLIVPILTRGMREKKVVYKRRCAVIMDSMCKLVVDPRDAVQFYPLLEPILVQGMKEIDKEEVRKVCASTLETLKGVVDDAAAKATVKLTEAELLEAINLAIKSHSKATEADLAKYLDLIVHVSKLSNQLVVTEDHETDHWSGAIVPYLTGFLPREAANAVAKEVTAKANVGYEMEEEYDADEEDLVRAEFSLAYGSRVLLHQTDLVLKRGRKYGLVGPNGAGKSTLMRSISTGNLAGFPTDVRTIYVEHDIQGYSGEVPVVQYVLADPKLQSTGKSEADVRAALGGVGFTEQMQEAGISTLSGGWRMKLALSRAMLLDPDMLMLDEPTNHLDQFAVQWLLAYLKGLTNVTCLIVSHDTKFLDLICTDIIHYEKNRKLKRYKGNLTDFVRQKPEARAYYELSSAVVKFDFPAPGPLVGVKSCTKAILKCSHVTYQYPTAPKPQVQDVSVQVSLASRVAIIGVNGAGKSTLIKILVGEIEPAQGEIYRHPNVRIAYVAQHAFHHIEQHLDKSPVQYVMWRYAGGMDKESASRDTIQITDAEWKKIKEIAKQRKLGVIDRLVGRINGKREHEYEVQFEPGQGENQYFTRTELTELGYVKMVQQFDEKLAQEQMGGQRKLTTAEIQKHYAEFGLEENFATHGTIGGLSGGQKVKVVLGAAMWNHPHIVILDEPTNFLDRDSLGALALAIKDFAGGVLMISHNAEFYTQLCPERWLLDDGKLKAEGGEWMKAAEEAEREAKKNQSKLAHLDEEEKTDAFGNTIKVEKKKTLDRSERKKLEKKRKEMLKRGEDTWDIDELLGLN